MFECSGERGERRAMRGSKHKGALENLGKAAVTGQLSVSPTRSTALAWPSKEPNTLLKLSSERCSPLVLTPSA